MSCFKIDENYYFFFLTNHCVGFRLVIFRIQLREPRNITMKKARIRGYCEKRLLKFVEFTTVQEVFGYQLNSLV